MAFIMTLNSQNRGDDMQTGYDQIRDLDTYITGRGGLTVDMVNFWPSLSWVIPPKL